MKVLFSIRACFCRSKKSKPIISGPFPVDPERLQGEKWRYVILTRLDTEQPPERPPRAKRHSNGQLWPKTTFGRWGSSQRRSFGRSSRDRPPRPIRRRTVAAAANDTKRLSAAQLLELMFRVYTRRPIAISLPSPSAKRQLAGKAKQMDRPSLVAAPVEKSCPPPAGVPTKGVDKASRPNKVVKKSKPSVLPPVPVKTDRSNGFIQSVDRIKAMANNLLL